MKYVMMGSLQQVVQQHVWALTLIGSAQEDPLQPLLLALEYVVTHSFLQLAEKLVMMQITIVEMAAQAHVRLRTATHAQVHLRVAKLLVAMEKEQVLRSVMMALMTVLDVPLDAMVGLLDIHVQVDLLQPQMSVLLVHLVQLLGGFHQVLEVDLDQGLEVPAVVPQAQQFVEMELKKVEKNVMMVTQLTMMVALLLANSHTDILEASTFKQLITHSSVFRSPHHFSVLHPYQMLSFSLTSTKYCSQV